MSWFMSGLSAVLAVALIASGFLTLALIDLILSAALVGWFSTRAPKVG